MGISVRTRLSLGLIATVMLFAFVLLLGVQQAHAQSESPVYRFYHQSSGSHFYTANEAERAYVEATLSHAYTFEGIAYWTAPDWLEAPTAPLHRFYNLRNGSHFYTGSEVEKTYVRLHYGDVYRYEGIAFYSLSMLFR